MLLLYVCILPSPGIEAGVLARQEGDAAETVVTLLGVSLTQADKPGARAPECLVALCSST
jgi:hypothetical protein